MASIISPSVVTQQRVVVTDHNFMDVAPERAAAAAAGASFDVHQCRTAEDVRKAIAGADVVVVQFAPVDEPALASLKPNARLVRYGVGYNNIDVASARSLGHDVAYIPDYCVDEVADHTAALVLALVRQIIPLDTSVRKVTWNVIESAPGIRAPRNLTLGLLGLGRIGRATLARLAPYGFKIVIHDPALDNEAAAQLGARSVSLSDIFAESDVLVLHLPLTEATRHIVDRSKLDTMKHGSFIVNCSRGGLIDELALGDALESGRLAGAALDVFETEPLPPESYLRSVRNLIMTPHAAWYSDTALDKLQALAADELTRGLRGDPPRCRVPVEE